MTAPATAVDDTEIGSRGSTELRERAVEKLVAAAAAEVDDVASPVSRVLGQSLGSADLDGRPRARVRLAGDLVTAEVSLSVRWPAPIGQVAGAVRERIRARLGELTDLRVGHVDVHVTALPLDERRRRRVH